MHFYRILIAFSILTTSILNGQTGNEFWLAAPDVSASHYHNSTPLNLHVTALYNTHVTISRPADPSFTPVEFDLGPQQTQETRLDALLTVSQIEVYSRNKATDANFIQNKGFLIEAYPGEVTAYYELVGKNNTDIIALKSKNALGTDFWVSTQRKYKNHGYSDDFSGFTVVATEDNTTVNITTGNNNLKYYGTADVGPITLNKGETFSIRAAFQDPDRHIFGIKVTSDKNIVINIFDDSMQIDDGSGNWDIFADQIVPTSLVGKEYIVLKGNVQDQVANTKDGEAIFITPTVDGTDIYIDDSLVTPTSLNTGDYFEYKIDSLATHVRGTEPIYVNHITGYSTLGTAIDDPAGARELGGAILPTIDGCTGSYSVTVVRTPASGFVFFNNLMVRVDTTSYATKLDAINHFTYSINGGSPIHMNPDYFTFIMDSSFAVYDRYKAGGNAYYNNVSDGQTLRVDNSVARFHLGVMQGKQSPGCKYGYFSDFANSAPAVGLGGFLQPVIGNYCSIDPIQLVAAGGTAYKWYAPAPQDPLLIEKLDDDSIAAPYFFPDTTGLYFFNVIITGECYSSVTLSTKIRVLESASTSFTFSADEGCSPFSPILTNQSDTVVGVIQEWTIYKPDGTAYTINQDTIPRTFKLDLPENHSDSIQTHTVELTVYGQAYSCGTTKSKDIKVKPQIESVFTASDTMGCHPLFVQFDNQSTGNIDTNSYLWNFGDNTQSFDSLPSKNYSNYSLNDTTYHAELVTTSPFGCTDTARKDIVVHPRIKLNVAVDTTKACSPLVSTLSPVTSIGADTLWWNIDYHYSDSVYKSTSITPITLTHYDTSTSLGPDTLYVQLIGSNRMGCMDTAITRQLIAFPDVIADLTISESVVCDSTVIAIDNNSFGYKLLYDWDFGDNTYSQDTTQQSYNKVFFNRSNSDTTYTVKLTATSGYFCSDEMDTNIIVHPYIKADFGINYENSCTPLYAEITNTSIRAQVNTWDFGSGVTEVDNNNVINKTYLSPLLNTDTTLTIKLVVRNPEGCFDSLSRPLLLYPQVVADFGFTTDSVGCAPLNIGLENKSTGGNLLYTWNYGDNSSSSTNDTLHSKPYNNISDTDTIYTLKLTAKNALGCDSVITRPVKVFAQITAEFNLPVTDSCSPFTIRPNNLSTIGAKVFDWDFGSGWGASSLANPIVPTYLAQDDTIKNLTIQLMAAGAADADHLACSDTHTVAIKVYPELEAAFFMPTTVSCQPLVSTITNQSNLITNSSFLWYIDNKFYSSDTTPPKLTQYNYQDFDTTFTVSLYGSTEYGCRDTATQDIEVYSLVEAYFSIAPSDVCAADSILIDQTYTKGGSGLVSRDWDFNNGESTSTISDNQFYKTFNSSNNTPEYQPITLTVANHSCDSTWTDSVLVYPKVTADFNTDTTEVCYPYSVQFTPNSINATNYFWAFGDGATSFEDTPKHPFNNFSKVDDITYNIKLKANSQYNCFDTITKQVTIFAKPIASFIAPLQADCPPFDVTMQNKSIGSSLDFDWLLDGISQSTDSTASISISNPGNSVIDRTVKLIVESDKGCADTTENEISVYPDVYVDFSISDINGCSPLNVSFQGDTTNAAEVLWSVDGKGFSYTENTDYRFVNETPGDKVFDITFKAQSIYDCSADTTKQITVFPSPVAEFIPSPLPADYGIDNDETPITFYNKTAFQNNWGYEWDYGDNTNDTQAAQEFTYTYGSYFWGKNVNDSRIPVTLIATNTAHPTCSDTVIRDIIIYAPDPQIDAKEDLIGCQPFTVNFSANTKYVDDNTYLWEFGYNGATSTEATPTFTFEEAGTYTVKLTMVGENGTTKWDYKIISVTPQPIVDFTFNDSIVSDKSQTKDYDIISFYNHTKYAENTGYNWYFDVENNFGGAPDSEESDPSWHYEEVGTYYVGLIAFSSEGCSDTLIHPTPITVEGEGYVKFPTAFLVNPNGAADETATYETDGKTNKYVFYPVSQGVETFHLEIYNRWGVRIFESKDIGRGWNGYIDNAPAKQDVYIWRARGQYSNGDSYDISGDITLIIGTNEFNVK